MGLSVYPSLANIKISNLHKKTERSLERKRVCIHCTHWIFFIIGQTVHQATKIAVFYRASKWIASKGCDVLIIKRIQIEHIIIYREISTSQPSLINNKPVDVAKWDYFNYNYLIKFGVFRHYPPQKPHSKLSWSFVLTLSKWKQLFTNTTSPYFKFSSLVDAAAP